ncbi:hypothetical protein K0I63_08415 [Shewanella rhizosphaerae]|uniref:hypothetical protein n=1 Tax=Shewanella rhizosphaerae TaxID=2864207 RepID=UPI001C65D91A|nr:hypothetical protein [Shewanella rhizosphaerae]QYK14487.1 hypothetical protein K0I63_08415 [Shewanella rhizosphaerae]
MKRFKSNRLVRALGIVLISGASLYGATITTANASFFPQKKDQACMAEQAGFNLNCTANDVRVSKVDNIRNIDGSGDKVECNLGEEVTFIADVTITTTANERYDYSVYLPEGNWSAQDSNPNNECSILLGRTDDPGVDLEEGLDACADISKAAGYSPTHLYAAEEITLFCRDDDNSGKAEFNYCMAWHNKTGEDCSEDDPAAPGTPSKCRCDSFDIDVFVKPEPPVVTKTLKTTDTHPEPGGTYGFELSIKNPNDPVYGSSLFITSLYDWIDEANDGNYETKLNLATSGAPAPMADGVYLITSNCTIPMGGLEIQPGGTYTCQFTVQVNDRDLPDNTKLALYNDVIKAHVLDKNDDPVVDGNTCAAVGVDQADGDHCTNELQVNVTNLPPSIEVIKTADPAEVLEPGDDVTFTITVKNTSNTWDSPLTLTALSDSVYGDLFNNECSGMLTQIPQNGEVSCSFMKYISGNAGDNHMNTAYATAVDDEADEATGNNMAKVDILDVPSMITLVKSADQATVFETGDDPTAFRNVTFTFLFTNTSTVDYVTFNKLTDVLLDSNDNPIGMATDITLDCDVNGVNLSTGIELAPQASASCDIVMPLQGNADDVHKNLATIYGIDDDGNMLDADDPEVVTFLPANPAADMAFATSMLVVLELHNAGLENVNLTALTVLGQSVFAEPNLAGFQILNEGGTYATEDYGPCNENALLGYNGSVSPSDTYSCAFTIELKPGLENAIDINFFASLANGVTATVTDDEGTSTSNSVSIAVQVDEPPFN